jgi:choline dehydrogenase-like flavoprotein
MAAAKGSRAANNTEHFDYLIVGAGTAGCVLANRLSADAATRVGLIEAGPAQRRVYESIPQRNLNNRCIPLRRGSINETAFFPGHPRDFDEWAQAGASGWGYEDVLPYFRKAGTIGARPEPRHSNPLVQRFLEAAGSLGFARCADFNGPDPEGFGCHQATRARTDRIVHRQNLAIFRRSRVTGLVIEDRKARGVMLERDGTRVQLSATRDVILCAGTYGSPQLLLLSGVGSGSALQALGIPVKHDLPGVGESLHHHPSTVLQMRAADSLPRGIWNVFEYVLFRRGLFASQVLEGTGFVKSRPREDRPDLQVVFMPMLRGHGFGIISIVVRPQSRGRVTLASPDPHRAPLVDPNYLDDSDDMRLMVEGATLARRILSASAFRSLRGVEVLPGPQTRDTASWTEYIRASTVGVHHASSTCRIGKDSFAVVDASLRVRGIDNLRVADASVFPRVVAGNTNAAVVMVAEKATDLVRSQARSAAALHHPRP